MEASFGNASAIIENFSDGAFEDIDTFAEELQANTAAAEEWQINLLRIGAATSPAFAQYLADMGLAGAGLVDDLADSPEDMNRIWWLWVDSTKTLKTDMTGMFGIMTDEIAGILQDLPDDVDWDELESIMLSNGLTIGEQLALGTANGIFSKTSLVVEQARQMAQDAFDATKAFLGIESPSKLFFTGIGVPIAEGVADGIESAADQISDALVESLQDAENSAVKAAEELISATVDAAWAAIDDPRSIEAAKERVSDTETSLEKARGELFDLESGLSDIQGDDPVETAAKIADAMERIADAKEKISDLETSLEDANLRLFKQLVETGSDVGGLGDLASAAGLTGGQFSGLVSALGMQGPIGAFNSSGGSLYDRMRYVGYSDEMLGGKLSGGIPDFFGGLTPTEFLGTQSYNVTINAGMGADAIDIGRIVVDAIKRYERLNGAGWRSP
jgi:hypothetical protein